MTNAKDSNTFDPGTSNKLRVILRDMTKKEAPDLKDAARNTFLRKVSRSPLVKFLNTSDRRHGMLHKILGGRPQPEASGDVSHEP